MSVPSPEQQINSTYRASATKGVLRPKVANSERQPFLILKINKHSHNVSRRRIVLYIGVLVMAKKSFQSVVSARRRHKQRFHKSNFLF